MPKEEMSRSYSDTYWESTDKSSSIYVWVINPVGCREGDYNVDYFRKHRGHDSGVVYQSSCSINSIFRSTHEEITEKEYKSALIKAKLRQ